MNKLLSLVVLAAATLCAQPSLTLNFVDNGPVRAGNTVRIKMTLSGAGGLGIAGLQAFPRSSVGGTFTAVDGPANTAAGKASYCATVNGLYNCLDVGMNQTAYSDGIVKYFDLTIPSNAATGQATISLTSVLAATVAGDAVAISTAPLNFTLASPISPCDLDGSGGTDVTDVTLSENMAVGLAQCSGDLDQDGKCTIADTVRVIEAALGNACRVGK